jgi:hypothetical protein
LGRDDALPPAEAPEEEEEVNLDDLRKSRPSLAAKAGKPPRTREGVSMNELRARFGLAPQPPAVLGVNAPKIPDEDDPPPPKKK